MRYLSLVLFLVIVMLPLALGQTTLDRALEAQLKRVFPAATTFSTKQTPSTASFRCLHRQPGFADDCGVCILDHGTGTGRARI